ncbi:ABC transporter substrate-binding protein [Lysinibacillus sp. NPDC059133]|uniref:ABC transporter substrate-binding protein n=1 Tax=Lysinibacillus sp. NPDC059133 TaxID=3346737 RepID=UPI0036CA533A
MKKWLAVFMLSFLTIVLVACNSDASTSGDSSKGESIKIGSLHPLSGGLALEGQEMKDAVKLAIKEKNDAGGIQSLGNKTIELIEADHEGSPEKGVSEVQKLDRAGVVGIVGAYSSGVALPATQEAERSRLPFIVDIGAADEITERGFKYTFRLQPAASSFSKDFLEYFKDLNENATEKLSTAVIVHEDSVFGTSIAKVIKDNAANYGLEILEVLPHASSTADLSSTINKISASKPDIVLTTTYLRDGVMLVEGIQNSSYTPRAIIGVANGAFSNAKFITDYQSINNLLMDVNYTINPHSDLAKDVKAKYKEAYGREMGPNAAYSFMATTVLLDAIERAGSTDREAIRKALTETNLEDHILPQEAIQFDNKGQNINAKAVLNQIIDGATKVVGPAEYLEVKPVYPSK